MLIVVLVIIIMMVIIHDEEVNKKANVLRNQMHSLHAQRQNLTNEASVEQNNCAFKYCNSYPDLKNAFCGGKDCTTSSEASSCFNHWYQYGKKEGRANNPVACSASSSNQGGLLAQKGTLKDRLSIWWSDIWNKFDCFGFLLFVLSIIYRLILITQGRIQFFFEILACNFSKFFFLIFPLKSETC